MKLPVVARFDGIELLIYFQDHNPPHLHAFYGDCEAVFSMSGEIMEGRFPPKQKKKVTNYIRSHQEELNGTWNQYKNS